MTILGLLLDEPSHGYALKRKISPALQKDQLVNDGILYPLLAKLEKKRWIERQIERGTKKPDRKVFHVTDAGREAFQSWLSGEEGEEGVTFDFFQGHPFLTKVMFFDRLPRDAVLSKLRARTEAAKRKLARFREIRAGMVTRGVGEFRVAIIELGIDEQRARIRWLTKEEKRLSEPKRRKR